jgi:hypothetical protein
MSVFNLQRLSMKEHCFKYFIYISIAVTSFKYAPTLD